MDISDYEGADIIQNLDLKIPNSLEGQFDCIIDPGTIEHCFNIPVVLKNLEKMLRPKGRILHWNGLTNAIDHGFYMFLTFFNDYYTAAGFQICDRYICEFNNNSPVFVANLYNIQYKRINWLKSKRQMVSNNGKK